MAKLDWTFQALEDLDEIGEYLSEQSAQELIETIFLKVELLENFPRMGRKVPELNLPHLRELIIKKYRVIYALPDIDTIHILTVRHSSRKLPESF
ncbi:MAG: type II toxin-antitoxin system RelE/ParE family toxin [Bacteroidota bacterium]